MVSWIDLRISERNQELTERNGTTIRSDGNTDSCLPLDTGMLGMPKVGCRKQKQRDDTLLP